MPRWLPVAVFAPLGLHFFETFPNGWDATEYVWCVEAGWLPHSPYPLFLFLGRLLHLVLPPAVALSSLSLAGGVASLVALAWLVRETAPCAAGSAEAAWRGATVGVWVACTPLFVRHATGQEVYALQLAVVLLSAVLAVSRVHRKHALSGAAFGAALAVHNGSVFLAPALVFLVASRLGTRGRRLRALAAWGGAAAGVLLVHYALLLALLPAAPGERLAELFVYLRGLPPGLDLAPLTRPGHALEAAGALVSRLTDATIATTRGPQATGVVGLTPLALVLALAGLAALFLRNRTVAIFWALWAAPFAVYEVALGWNLDFGVYLVFLLPPAAVLAAEAAWWPVGRVPRVGAALAAVLVAALAAPAAAQLWGQWGDARADGLRHDSAATLAARWAAESLPAEAVVVQPRSEWNANLLPLHAKRRHVARSGRGLELFSPRGRWTPMRPDAYETLTSERLRALLESGVPVFAFEPAPLDASATPGLDPERFRWRRTAEVDLEPLARRLGAREPERFAGRRLPVYRASLSSERSSPSGPTRSR